MSKKKSLIKIFGALIAIGLIIGIYAFSSFYYPNFVAKNIVPKEGQDSLVIFPGDSPESILAKLSEMGVIENKDKLQWTFEKKNYKGSNIVPGLYIIREKMSNNAFTNFLRAGNGREDTRITVNSCRYIDELAGMLSKNIFADSIEIYQWLANEDSIAQYGFNKFTITAMFLPDTYFINYVASVPEVMQRLHAEYLKYWTPERQKLIDKNNLTPINAITVASIVDAETNMSKDMPIIAGVYLNRLRIGMPLQADPTLKFALGNHDIQRVLNKDKLVDSPYNTYKNKGLPPGPIMIPSKRAIEAVINPDQHKYLYFVAKADLSGYSDFSKTYNEHLRKARAYQRALDKRNIKR